MQRGQRLMTTLRPHPATPSPAGPSPSGPAAIEPRSPHRRPHRRLRRWLVGVVALLSLATLAWSLVSWDGAAKRLQQAEHATSRERHRLAVARFVMALAEGRLAQEVSRGHVTQGGLDSTEQELLAARSELDGADSTIGTEGLNISKLDQCLTGVQSALAATNSGDQAGAVAAIQLVSSTCLSLVPDGAGGPVYPFDFPDPSILAVGTGYYAYGTNSAEGNIQILSSANLTQWNAVGNALPSVPTWAGSGDTWAPAVSQVGSTYVLYYTVKDTGAGVQCISAAVSSSPAGPFADTSAAPLECQPDLGGSIDPDPFVDTDGQLYLVWKSEGTASQPPGLWSQRLDAAGTALYPWSAPSMLLQSSQGWEDGVVEAPDMVYAGGAYDLLYSGANWSSAGYAIGEAVCQGPAGPCTKPLSAPILQSGQQFSGPGGPAVFTAAGGQTELAFAAYLPQAVGYPNSRLLFVRPLQDSGGLLAPAGGT